MKPAFIIISSVCFAAALSLSCESTGGSVKQVYDDAPEFTAAAYDKAISSGSWIEDNIHYTFKGTSANVPVQIYFPKEYVKGKKTRAVIVLHGYRGGKRDWQANTSIVSYANKYGMVLVCPAMANTIYETAYYPQTTNKWGPLPGGRFIVQTLVPWLNKRYSIAKDKSLTGIMGNSTGGRGAVLAAETAPDMFCAAAGLSGDYDPEGMPRNRLLAAVYGEYKNFADRWATADNPMKQAEALNGIPVYIGHGNKDGVVPLEQSLIFAMKLRQLNKEQGNYSVTYKEYAYSLHDWTFWNRALPEVMRFFDENLAKTNE